MSPRPLPLNLCRVRREELAFPEPPPRDEPAALAAAGVQDLPEAPADGQDRQQDEQGQEAERPHHPYTAPPPGFGSARVEIEPIPVVAEAVPPALAARHKAPAGVPGDNSGLRQPLLGPGHVLAGAAPAGARPAGPAGKPAGVPPQLLAPPTPTKAAFPGGSVTDAGGVVNTGKTTVKAGM